jgi:hypothetical protein
MSGFNIGLGAFRLCLRIYFCSASHPVWSYKTCNRGYKTCNRGKNREPCGGWTEGAAVGGAAV